MEEQELGNIFETLFSDAAFVKKAKETINKTLSWQFTRAELLDAINKLDENRLWTLLMGDDCVETLCSSFSEIRNYRNDVMHAHNIDYEQFNKAHKLFKKVNTELDSAIGKLIGAKETNTEVTSTDFNNTLSSALAALHSPIDTSSLLAASEALKGIVSNQPIINPEVSKSLSQIGAVDKVSLCSALPTKKDAHRRHPACFIIRFRFNAVADKRQWSSAASKPRRKMRAKLCSRFCAENEPSHQTCRSFSASRYSGL